MNFARLIFILSVSYFGLTMLLFISCKKETIKNADTALPDMEPTAGFTPGFPKSAGLFSCFSTQYLQLNQKENKGLATAFAVFNDPETYMYSRMDIYSSQPGFLGIGNLNMGRVALNNYPLPWYNGTYSGTPQSLMSFDTALVWKIPGVEGAPGFTDRFQLHFPTPGAAMSASITMRSSQGYVLETADFFKNYDSIFLKISYTELARLKPGTKYFQVSEADIVRSYPSWQDSLLLPAELKAFKYYHSRHSGKTYQYLFVTKVPVQLLLVKN